MEEEIEAACKDRRVAGVALLASNSSGTFEYGRAFGARSLDPAKVLSGSQPPLQLDTLMRIASATKLITSVAVMQCVDRGLIGLDDDVRHYEPDLKEIKILTGFDENDQPVLLPLTEKLTLRRLLSHSSGFHYDALSPLLVKWRKLRGEEPDPPAKRLLDRYLVPLVSEPGTDWCYSQGIDWAGRVIERASGESLEQLLQKHIVEPLDIKKMTFFPHQQPAEFRKDHADMTARDKTSGKVVHSPEIFWDRDNEDALGGLGVFTTAEDFFKVLKSILSNDGKLMSRKARNEMLSPQLTAASKDYLNKQFFVTPQYEALGMGGCFPPGSERNHSLAGMYLVEEMADKETPRRPGTIAWMGMPNFIWFLDPATGICGLFAAQLKPPDDEVAHNLAKLFEQTVYERLQTSI